MNENLVYLVQTDTTVGFCSANYKKLNSIKNRVENQKVLATIDSFKTLQKYTRVPKKYRKLVRNTKKTTFIYPNQDSFRVIDKNSNYHNFIKKFSLLYSSSANKTKEKFSYKYAKNLANIEVIDKNGFYESSASKIFRLYKKRVKKLR